MGFTLVELMVVIGILGLLVGILAVAVIPRMLTARKGLEVKRVGDLMSAIEMIETDEGKKRRMGQEPIRSSQGRKFYEAALKSGIIDVDNVNNLVALATNGQAAPTTIMDDESVELGEENCDWTAPRGSDVRAMLNRRGAQRRIFLSFNSQMWASHPYDNEVLVRWTDGQTAVYLTHGEMDEYNIDANSWNERPEDIIGVMPPFERTFD